MLLVEWVYDNYIIVTMIYMYVPFSNDGLLVTSNHDQVLIIVLSEALIVF